MKPAIKCSIPTRNFSSGRITKPDGKTTIKRLDPNDNLSKVIDICVRSFELNAFHVWRKTPKNIFQEYFEELVPKAAHQGLSVIAIQNGEPVGYFLNGDLMDPDYLARYSSDPNSTTQDIDELITWSVEYYLENHYPGAKLGDIFMLEIAGVEPSLARKGTFKQMIQACVEIGRENKFKRGFLQCINPVTTQTMKKAGFNLVKSLDYESFVMKNGTRPYIGIKQSLPNDTFDIMDLDLQKK